MKLLEMSFTAYSGTSVENFRDSVFRQNGNYFYTKSDNRFRYPQGVYYTSRAHVAADYARSLGWEYEQTPLIMAGRLPLLRRFPPGVPKTVKVFPVNRILILDRNLDDINWFDDKLRLINPLPFFIDVSIEQILTE